MKHYCDQWILEWCEDNGWTDLFVERNLYWAFPPGAVMPEPIPSKILRLIKAQKGLAPQEKFWLKMSGVAAILALVFSYMLRCPMPLVFAFAFNAVTVARLEVDEV